MTNLTKTAGAMLLGSVVALGGSFAARPAQASYIATLVQIGSNVVANGSGTIDLADLALWFSIPQAEVRIGPIYG